MRSRIKLTAGERYGRLTVVSLAPPSEKYKQRTMYHCRCDCGNEVDIPAYYLTRGITTSCGCSKHIPRADVAGQRFGLLVAIEPTGEISKGAAVWLWRCDCGKEIEATLKSVKWGGKRSCGCTKKAIKQKQAADARNRITRIQGTNLNLIRSNSLYSNNSSGHRNVCWHQKSGAWYVRIGFQGKTYSLGYYADFEEACKVADEAKAATHGAFVAWYDAHIKKEEI